MVREQVVGLAAGAHTCTCAALRRKCRCRDAAVAGVVESPDCRAIIAFVVGSDSNRRDAAGNGSDPLAVSVANVGRLDPIAYNGGSAVLKAL